MHNENTYIIYIPKNENSLTYIDEIWQGGSL